MAINEDFSGPSPYRRGDSIGEYVLLEKLGGKITFKAVRRRDQKTVAIKIFHKSLERAQELYRNEVQAFDQTVGIPGVLQLLDRGESDGDSYIVTEFMEFGTLQDLFGRHPTGMSIEEVLLIFTPIAHTVDQLHAHNIIHRDLKPANILLRQVNNKYETFITDFGFVKFTDFSEAYTTGTTSGTWWYIAPEAWNTDPEFEKTKAVDIYAVGVMLYEALEGKTPFSSLEDVFNKPLPRPELALQKTDERSISYILKSLSKQPEERPRSAGEIVAGMQNAYESRVKLKNHWIGRTFKDYKVENILPRGMVSISFRARDLRNGDPVVLKMFDASYSVGMSDDDYRQSFEAEINALQKLEDGHGILKPRDHFSQEDLYFIVTDYKSGGNLRALLPRIQNRTLEIDDALNIFLQIAKSIDYVHEQNIIHRDIKPDNIVFSEEDGKIDIYLTDFGVAEVMATSQISFKTLHFTGTHRYMAPELWDAKARKTKAIDIYAFGIMVYEAFEGRVPFDAELPAIINEHLHGTIPRPSRIAENLGPKAVKLIEQSMAKDPASRPSSAVVFMQNLIAARQEYATQRGIIGGGIGTSPGRAVWPKMPSRQNMQYYAAVLVALMAIVLLVFNLVPGLASPIPTATVVPFTATTTATDTPGPTVTSTITSTGTATGTPTTGPLQMTLNQESSCWKGPGKSTYDISKKIAAGATVAVLGKSDEEGSWYLISTEETPAVSTGCWVPDELLVLTEAQNSLVPVVPVPTRAPVSITLTPTRDRTRPSNTPEPNQPSLPTRQPPATRQPPPTSTPCKNPNNPNKCPTAVP